MRTAVVSYHSSPLDLPGSGDAGGMTVYVRELAHALARRGVATDAFTRAVDGRFRVIETDPGVRVVTIPAGPPGSPPKDALAEHLDEFAAEIVRRAPALGPGYELVHSHYWQSGLAGLVLKEAWGVPLVHSHHTLARVKHLHLPPGDVLEPPARLAGEDRVISGADVLAASTAEERDQLVRLYGAHPARVRILHPGVNTAVFTPGDRAAARAALGLAEQAVVAYVGRIQPLKGIDLALRAVEQLTHALERDVVLLVVGGASGPSGAAEVQRLRSLARSLGIAGQVRFMGRHDHDALPSIYRAADVVVVCSHSESFGLAALEAHACGVPVVGTAVGGLAQVVRDGASGFLVHTRDPSEFAARLKTLLTDDLLRARMRQAAVAGAANFTWERGADEFLDLYRSITGRNREEISRAADQHFR